MTNDDRVLVVEDRPVSRDVLVRICRSHGYQVEEAEDGAGALAQLEAWQPDVILLDVNMPGMSGFEVLRSIRERHTADRLPVLMVTARDATADVVAGLEAGANDYVTKPITGEVLLARLRAALRLKRDVERLLAAERYRVQLNALADICERIAEPMEVVLSHLQGLSALADGPGVQAKVAEVSDWAHRVADLIQRLEAVASHRETPYTEGMEGFIAASLESARQDPNGGARDGG